MFILFCYDLNTSVNPALHGKIEETRLWKGQKAWIKKQHSSLEQPV